MTRTYSIRLLIATGLLLAGAGALVAQPAKTPPSGPPNALQGFSQNRGQPVHIDAATLEVRDKDKVATFSGNVHVVQGDTDMHCKVLVVFYEQDDGGAGQGQGQGQGNTMTAADPGPGGEQRIKKLEARGSVVVTQKDQTATGNLGVFEMATNTVTLTGNVVMTQGKNVVRGDKLTVDLTTGISHVESGKNGAGRVQGLFLPGSGPVGPGGASEGKPGSNARGTAPMPLSVQPLH